MSSDTLREKPKNIFKIEHGWKYRAANREKERARFIRYQKSNGWKKKTPRDPVKHKAGVILRNAVAAGKLTRPLACSHCGAITKIQGHHRDYSKPLEVI